jgi:ribonuclease HI
LSYKFGGELAKKYYVVWNGRKTGVFNDWASCKKQVDQFSDAKFKSFSSKELAIAAFDDNLSVKNTKVTKAKKNNAQRKPLTSSTIFKMPFDVKIFSDGASEPNPGEAGSGVAVYENNTVVQLWYGGYEAFGTNNLAELKALYYSFHVAEMELKKGKSVAIYSDSTYSIQCITKWASGWEKKGWKKSGGEIKNLQLIQEMFVLYKKIEKSIEIYHVNGHVGIEGNELADRMSIIAIDEQENDFHRYSEPFDIYEILALRTG